MLVKQDILGLIFRIFDLRLGLFPEAATRGALWKKMFLEISQNSQENTCVSSPVPDFNLFQFLQIFKIGKGLIGSQFVEGVALKEGVTFFLQFLHKK